MPSPTTSSATNQNVPASLDPNVNALLAGVKWDARPAGTGASLTYSFPWDGDRPAVFAGYNGAPYSDLHEDTADVRYGLDGVQGSRRPATRSRNGRRWPT